MKWFGRKKAGAGKPDKRMAAYLAARQKMVEAQAAERKATVERTSAMEAEQAKKAEEAEEAKQAGKKAEGVVAKRRTLASLFEPEEFERAKAMAKEAMAWQPFIDACKRHNVQKPVLDFLGWYSRLKGNPDVWRMEAKAEERVEAKGGRFNRTGFYAQLFIDFLNKRAEAKGRA